MQMRSGLLELPAIPLAPIKREPDTVFLGVRLRMKKKKKVMNYVTEIKRKRLNTAARRRGWADANYIWLLPPAGSASQTPACFQTFSHALRLTWVWVEIEILRSDGMLRRTPPPNTHTHTFMESGSVLTPASAHLLQTQHPSQLMAPIQRHFTFLCHGTWVDQVIPDCFFIFLFIFF